MRCPVCNKPLVNNELPELGTLDWNNPDHWWCFKCRQKADDNGVVRETTSRDVGSGDMFLAEGLTEACSVEGDE